MNTELLCPSMLACRYRNKVCLGRYLFCYFEVGIICHCGKIVAKAIWQSNCLRSPKEKWFRLRSPFLLARVCASCIIRAMPEGNRDEGAPAKKRRGSEARKAYGSGSCASIEIQSHSQKEIRNWCYWNGGTGNWDGWLTQGLWMRWTRHG